MKKYAFPLLLTTVLSSTPAVYGQTTTTSAKVQSYTNTDLNQSNPTPSNSNIPGMNANQTATTTKYPALTPEQIQQFNEQMNSQIQNSEQRVQSLMGVMQDQTRMPMDIDRVALEGAITDLDVKKTIFAKFQGSPSLKSPKVRQALLDILSKNYIQESDIATLQAIVDAERPYTYP